MRLAGRVLAGPGAVLAAARAWRLLVRARRRLRAGEAADEVLRSLSPPGRGAQPGRRAALSPDRAAAAVRRAAALLPGTTCVPRAVAMASLVTPSAREVAVVLGARRGDDARWLAHAWVEVDRRAWLDGGGSFQRLATYEARHEWALTPDDDAP